MSGAQEAQSDRKRGPESQSPPPDESVATKRRAPYAPKACLACRKRKGKCDGEPECEYCRSKGIQCTYTTQADWRRPTTVSQSPAGNGVTPRGVMEVIAGLQGQLNALNSLVQASAGKTNILDPSMAVAENVSLSTEELSRIQITANATGKQLARFWGPTSPTYSLKTAKSTLQNDPGSANSHNTLDYFDGSTAVAANENEDSEVSSSEEEETVDHVAAERRNGLLRFRDKMRQEDALRFLQIYQKVIGNFHPVVSESSLTTTLTRCYTTTSKQTDGLLKLDEDELIVLNLAIAIALTAEPSAYSKLRGSLLRQCRELFSVRLTRSTTDTNTIVIALLMAFYHFFKDNVIVAWRLCGTAGRLSMELGLHTSESIALIPGQERRTLGIVLSSIIVLDRQWSAATGLPIHFLDGSFDRKLLSEVEIPYLRAMLSFCLISEKIAEPITLAAKGQVCLDDDTFEISNYQVEQWRKKTLAGQNFIPPSEWEVKCPDLAPWTVLIYLRANTIKKLLLRPFFLPSAPVEVGKRNLEAGLDIIFETIDCLDCLDKNTDVYRLLHPHFQHLLTSASALLLLIVAFICQHRAEIDGGLQTKAQSVVTHRFPVAVNLAAKYKSSFRASTRLWKYLTSMKEVLRLHGFLTESRPVEHRAMDAKPAVATRAASKPSSSTSTWHHFFPPPFQAVDNAKQLQPPQHIRIADTPFTNFNSDQWQNGNEAFLEFSEADFANLSWPLNDGNLF